MRSWKTRNDMSVAELWIELFEFYSLGFNYEDNVVSVRKSGGFTRNEKQWKGKKLTIEDPFSHKRSLTRFIGNASVFDFISSCFKIAYLYFGCIQTLKGPIITRIVIPDSDLSRSVSPSAVSEEKADDAKSAVAKSPPGGGAAASGNKGPMTLEELERVILGDSRSGH